MITMEFNEDKDNQPHCCNNKSLFGQQKMVTQFSSLITHHSFFHSHLATSLLFSSLNFFTLFMGPTPVSRYIFFFPVPNSPKLILLKKKKKKTERPIEEKKRKEKKKKHKQPTPTQEKKKKKKKSKGDQKLRLWVPYMCLITILPLSYELWKLKTAKSCFQFP